MVFLEVQFTAGKLVPTFGSPSVKMPQLQWPGKGEIRTWVSNCMRCHYDHQATQTSKETFFIEDLRHQVLLPSTQALQNLIKELQNKKRWNMAHLLLNRRNDEQRMDKSRIRLETLDDTIRCAWLPPPHLQ